MDMGHNRSRSAIRGITVGVFAIGIVIVTVLLARLGPPNVTAKTDGIITGTRDYGDIRCVVARNYSGSSVAISCVKM